MNIDFSIITVTFQAEQTLPRTLDSVAEQTCRAFEHLIIDGGSHDGTLALADRYRAQNPDIGVTVVSEPDRGLYDAMNKGIRLARGHYLIFLNAGDRLHAADTLARVTAVIRDNRDGRLPAVLYGETDVVDAEGRFVRHRRLRAPRRLRWTSFRQGMLVCHQSFYALRETAPLYDLRYRFSADFDWCVRVMRQAHDMGLSLVNTHLVLTDYLAEGMTTQNHKASLRERFRIMARHYGWLTTVVMHGWFVLRQVWRK